jgi:hypothetical protein
MSPDDYNKQELTKGAITPADVSRATRIAQAALGFKDAAVDGKLGPGTRAALLFALAGQPVLEMGAPLTINDQGWLVGDGVKFVPTHVTWRGGKLEAGKPEGVVCHVSATNPGTALNMAKRRARPFGEDPDDRLSSWHASVETNGEIVQMVSFTSSAHHAGSKTARKVPGLGWANGRTNGIELIGWERGPFPEKQVLGYARLLRAIVRHYNIPRAFAMITHASIDPGRRSDPGEEWMEKHAERVLDLVYA